MKKIIAAVVLFLDLLFGWICVAKTYLGEGTDTYVPGLVFGIVLFIIGSAMFLVGMYRTS